MKKFIVKKGSKEFVFYTYKEISNALGFNRSTIIKHLEGSKNKVDKMGYEISLVEIDNDLTIDDFNNQHYKSKTNSLIKKIIRFAKSNELSTLIICYSKKRDKVIFIQDKNGIREQHTFKEKEKKYVG